MQRFSQEPQDREAFTQAFDRFYSRVAPLYDLAAKALPAWRRWLRRALPHLRGPRVLEVSFGTGWLMTQYADRFETHGIDLNERMLGTARANLRRCGLQAELQQGSVESLPYLDGRFDSVLCTMAFSGYPDARRALSEMLRVLGPRGCLLLIDVNYPADGNWIGSRLVDLWKGAGDLVRDMDALFQEQRLDASDEEIGGRGSVHLYLATRPQDPIRAQR